MIDEDGSSGVPAGYKYYYFQDRRFSVVALAATSTTGVGVVGERYRYTAFGQWTVVVAQRLVAA